mmetsp:Transcript_32163/g.73912  ORF Transcript_32163/g.73912 Transcript_32163/m.73912 type:complete len:205 (+) Transcript_32163:81-695(+)|eukprot:CAMPEP_0116830610 /NCGR_PEP_ID=MMETSP0418-20121206/4856_1 /TAXON_ID=1158023 /ORGANISM="Astrosyne radiata, Strain 13vi08-1A" /LENGTH=204 /DNA_ID=CAMNT_0004459727 /DNA_START=87 /DNA_END=701 /DNA_ORIENTATION=+
MSIMQQNGAAIIAMVGKDCVGIASDLRLSAHGQLLAADFPKVFQVSDTIFVGLPGLATDMQTMLNIVKFRMSLYELREERPMPAKVLSHLFSHLLYERRFAPYFVEPLVIALEEDGKPFLSSSDFVGATGFVDDFMVGGSCSPNLNSMCESLYRPGLEPDDLFEVLAQCMMNATDRHAKVGNGAVVHIITKDGVTTRVAKGRQD